MREKVPKGVGSRAIHPSSSSDAAQSRAQAKIACNRNAVFAACRGPHRLLVRPLRPILLAVHAHSLQTLPVIHIREAD